MGQRNSERLSEVLKDTGYRITKAERVSIESVDHLEELKPLMDWFADFINSDRGLTQDELRMFEDLEDEENILYGEELENALDEFLDEHAEKFDDVIKEFELEFMPEEVKETDNALQHLRSLWTLLSTRLQRVKESASSIDVKKKKFSKELSEIVTCLFELNNSLSNMLNTLLKTWNDLRQPLMEFDKNDVNGQLRCQQSLVKYMNETSKFEQNLSRYFKYQFNDHAKADVTVLESLMSKLTCAPANEPSGSCAQGKSFPQIKCKKLVRELEGVQKHIKINREEKTLASADEKAYSLALEQMNTLIESFNSGLKVTAPDVRLQSIENGEKLAKVKDAETEGHPSLSQQCERLSTSKCFEKVSKDQVIKLKRQEVKLDNLNRLRDFIVKRLHCDEYLILFLENELLKIDLMINFLDDTVNTAGTEWEDLQKNQQTLMNQEDFVKKQAVQLCKGHPLINTLNALYKLKADDFNDITVLVHTMEVQNKIITDVSYQLAHLYNLGGINGKDSVTYMRELTNNIFSGKARQPPANVNKAMVPVKSTQKQVDDLLEVYKHQRRRFEEHIEYLTRNPYLKSEQSLWSLFLVRPLEFKNLCAEAKEKIGNRQNRVGALTFKSFN